MVLTGFSRSVVLVFMVSLAVVITAVNAVYAKSRSGSSHRESTSQTGTTSEWRFYVAPSVFGAGMTGNLTTGGNTFPINASLDDLTENIQFGPFLTLSGKKGAWGFVADVGYLGSKGTGTADEPIDVDLDNLIVEGDAAYSPADGLTLLLGLRMYKISQTVTLPSSPAEESSTTVVDPIFGARGEWDLNDAWLFRIRGDVGGLGISSEMTYQGSLLFGWRFSEAWDLHFGYRVFWYQIQKDSIQTNIRLSGLNIGVGYDF